MLLGLVCSSLVLMGIGLCGLFLMPVMSAVVGGLALATFRFARRTVPTVYPAAAPNRIWGWLGLPAILFSPLLLVPPVDMDAWHYHLAAPEHFLKLHRFHTAGTFTGFNLELIAELQNTLPVSLRMEALGCIIPFLIYMAAVRSAGTWLTRNASPLAGGVGIGLLISISWALGTATAGKNDAMCAGACLIALLAQADRRYVTAAFCWGAAASLKVNGLLFACIATLSVLYSVGRPGWRLAGTWLTGASLALPTLARNYLVLGDPHWPILNHWFGIGLGEPELRCALTSMLERDGHWGTIITALFANVRDGLPALLIFLPVVIMNWARIPSRILLVGVLGVTFIITHTVGIWYEADRLSLPGLAAMCIPIAAGMDWLLRSQTPSVKIGLLLLATLSTWLSLPSSVTKVRDAESVRFLTGANTRETLFDRRWTGNWRARHALSSLPGVTKLMLTNDRSVYLWPGMVWTEEFGDRSPTWALTRVCATLPRLLIRVRQMGISHIALNTVEPFHLSPRGKVYRCFAWSPRQMRLLRDFMCSHVTWIHVSPTADLANGAYMIGQVNTNALLTLSQSPDLPGAKEVLWRALQPFLDRGDAKQSLANAAALYRAWPEIISYRHLYGSMLYHTGQWEMALEILGTISPMAYPGNYSAGLAAMAAINARKPLRAEHLANQVLEVYTDRREQTLDTLSSAMALQAANLASKPGTSLERALSLVQEAARLKPQPNRLVRLCMGRVLRRAGRFSEAQSILERLAAETPTDDPVGKECGRELNLSRMESTRN